MHLDPAKIVLDLDMKVMHQNVELRAELARLKNELRDKDEELKKMEGRRRFIDNSTRIVGGLWRKHTGTLARKDSGTTQKNLTIYYSL